jgi:hypothetical protein
VITNWLQTLSRMLRALAQRSSLLVAEKASDSFEFYRIVEKIP